MAQSAKVQNTVLGPDCEKAPRLRATSAVRQGQRLQRFVDAQRESFAKALLEIQKGRKSSCWMWFIIPTPPHIVKE